MKRFAQFMEWLWWRGACPQPDGWVNCTFRWRGGPYAWTKRWHTPWYLLNHPAEKWRNPKAMAWHRFAVSLLALPVGLVVVAVRRSMSAPAAGSASPDPMRPPAKAKEAARHG